MNFENTFGTSQGKHLFSTIKTYRLMLIKDTAAVYSEYHKKQAHCRQNAEFCYVKADGKYRTVGLSWITDSFQDKDIV
jgi:hypothetical protein